MRPGGFDKQKEFGRDSFSFKYWNFCYITQIISECFIFSGTKINVISTMFTVNLKLGQKKMLQNFNISSNLGRMLLKATDPGKLGIGKANLDLW